MCNTHTKCMVCLKYQILSFLIMHQSHFYLYRCLVKKTSPILPSLSPLLLRCGSLLLSSSLLLIARVSLLHGHLPHFSDHDNPASFSPHTLTRSLTYSYLAFFNAGLLVFPLTLCYDWQMGSIYTSGGESGRLQKWRNCLALCLTLFSLCHCSLQTTPGGRNVLVMYRY